MTTGHGVGSFQLTREAVEGYLHRVWRPRLKQADGGPCNTMVATDILVELAERALTTFHVQGTVPDEALAEDFDAWVKSRPASWDPDRLSGMLAAYIAGRRHQPHAIGNTRPYWLIERGSPAEWLEFRPWSADDVAFGSSALPSRWTTNAANARRFETKAEAEDLIRLHADLAGARATEHMDCGDWRAALRERNRRKIRATQEEMLRRDTGNSMSSVCPRCNLARHLEANGICTLCNVRPSP